MVYDGRNRIIAREVQERIESVLSPEVGEIECTAMIEEDQFPEDALYLELSLKRMQDKESDKEQIVYCNCALYRDEYAEIKEFGVAGLLRGIGIGSIVLSCLHEVLREKGYRMVLVKPSRFCFKDSGPYGFSIKRTPPRTTQENRVKFYELNGYKILEGDYESCTMIRYL